MSKCPKIAAGNADEIEASIATFARAQGWPPSDPVLVKSMASSRDAHVDAMLLAGTLPALG